MSVPPPTVLCMVAALSPSRAADFMQCPLLYRFRVIDKLPSPSAAAARGTLVHSVLERLFDLSASARTIEAATAMVEPQWRALLEGEPELADLVDETDPAAVAGWFGDAVALIERWFTLEDPTRLEPAERELYVETDLDGLTLRGYVDRLDVAPTGEMRGRRLQDRPVALGAVRGQGVVPDEVLRLVLWRMRGEVPRMLQLVYLADSEIVRYCPDEADLLAVERKLKALWKAIETAAQTGDWRPSKSKALRLVRPPRPVPGGVALPAPARGCRHPGSRPAGNGRRRSC